jgi:hypothetical protein
VTAPRPAPDCAQWCADHRHPGATYNSWLDVTVCACGVAWIPGNHAGHVVCCGGPLDRRRGPVTFPVDPHQQETDRRRLADFLASRRGCAA